MIAVALHTVDIGRVDLPLLIHVAAYCGFDLNSGRVSQFVPGRWKRNSQRRARACAYSFVGCGLGFVNSVTTNVKRAFASQANDNRVSFRRVDVLDFALGDCPVAVRATVRGNVKCQSGESSHIYQVTVEHVDDPRRHCAA